MIAIPPAILLQQSQPDTFPYFAGGFAVIFGLIGAYALSLRLRRFRKEHELRSVFNRRQPGDQDRSEESKSL